MIVKHEGIDPRDGIALRTYLEALRSWFATERQSWDTQYTQLASYFLPRAQRFNYSNVDTGFREDYSIVDNTATMALNVLAAGIFSSVSSPTQKWFHMRMEQDDLNDVAQVAEWLEEVEAILGHIMLKSNYYQTLLGGYREQALYGTCAYSIVADRTDVIRCHPYPIGSYYVSGDDTLRIDCVMRIINKTTRQLVDEFGFENVSDPVKSLYKSNAGGQKEFWWPVVHTVMKNTYFDASKPHLKEKPWLSVYYELSSYNAPQGLLRKAGFDEMPVVVSRWDVVGENFYGESPSMNALGDVRELQLLHKRKSQAIDKQVNPPMVGNPALENQKVTVLPGQTTFAEMRDGNPGFKPAYMVDFQLEGCLKNIADCRERINDALFKSLFLMNSESDRRQITAEEIRARQQEKMLVLGPVALRNDSENLAPGVHRIFMLAYRAGKIPPIPKIIIGKPVKFEFESILAQAQKIQRTANIDRLMAFLGSQVAVNQGVLDNFNLDDMARDYGKLLSVPPDSYRDPKEVANIRANRAKQQQQQQAADNAQKLAAAGQNLSQTDVRSDSALTRLLPSLAQPTATTGA